MTKQNQQKGFAKTPDLTAILNSDSAKNFIDSGEATPETKVEKVPVKVNTVKAKAKPSKPTQDDMPWMSADPKTRVQHIVRLPDPLKKLIEYLGDTGKGMNQTSISVEGMTIIAETIAKERGLPLPETWGSWL